MKSLLFVSLFAATSVFAGPFEKFTGHYKPITSPRIVKDNILYCNWFNISLMKGLIIDQRGENEGLELISTTNGGSSTQRSMMTFIEFSHPDEQYPRHATLSGSDTRAEYTVTNWSDSYHYVMSNDGANYLFELTYVNKSGGRQGACHYTVELQKIK